MADVLEMPLTERLGGMGRWFFLVYMFVVYMYYAGVLMVVNVKEFR